MNTEAENGVMQPQATDGWPPSGAGQARKGTTQRLGEHGPADTLGSEATHFVSSSHPVCGPLSQQH